MSVLDTFYILFKSDTDDVEEGAEKADKVVDKLDGSIQASNKSALAMGKSLNMLATQAVAAFGSVFAVTQLISNAKGLAIQATTLGVLSDTLGVSARELTNWGRAVEQVGGTVQGFEGSMDALGSGLRNFSQSGPNATTKALQKIGVNATDSEGRLRTVLDLLPDLSRELSARPFQDALSVGAELGLDRSTILLLLQGEKAVGKLVAAQDRLNLVSEKDLRMLIQLNREWLTLKNRINDLSVLFFTKFIPAVLQVEGSLEALGVVLAALVLKAGFMVAPFVLTTAAIAAAIAALGILAHDIKAYSEGEITYIERLNNRYSILANFLESIRASKEALGDFFSGDRLREFVRPGQKHQSNASQYIQPQGFWNTLGAATGVVPLEKKPGSVTNSTLEKNATTVTIGPVTVNTQSADPDGIARELAGVLGKHIRNAIDTRDDGLLA